MDNSVYKKQVKCQKRAQRVRKRLRGSAERPRLCFFKSNCHLQAQIIDDGVGRTLGSISTFSKAFKENSGSTKSKEAARLLGVRMAEIAKQNNIATVIFDRGKSKYHGVVAAFADAVREGGLQF